MVICQNLTKIDDLSSSWNFLLFSSQMHMFFSHAIFASWSNCIKILRKALRSLPTSLSLSLSLSLSSCSTLSEPYGKLGSKLFKFGDRAATPQFSNGACSYLSRQYGVQDLCTYPLQCVCVWECACVGVCVRACVRVCAVTPEYFVRTKIFVHWVYATFRKLSVFIQPLTTASFCLAFTFSYEF